jgi:hypothetical protein
VRIQASVFNRLHYPIEIEGYTFQPGKATMIWIETNSMKFRNIRTKRGLRVNRHNNEKYMPIKGKSVNMIYDKSNQHALNAYQKAIEALAQPIIDGLTELGIDAGYASIPTTKLNVRFFSSYRINQQGKSTVGPNDVFYSHGIGDKNYWTADRIEDYKYAMVPGPAWKDRIMAGGFQGEVFVVGYTKLDPLFNGQHEKQAREKPLVVWAPSHGYNARHKGRSSYPWCMKHIEEISPEYEAILALHPTTRQNLKMPSDVSKQELIDADVIIADAGSTIYESWALGKPVIFPDWICHKDVLGHFKDDPCNFEYRIYKEQIGYHARDMKELNSMIGKALVNGMQQREIEFMEGIFPAELRGISGITAANTLKNLL